MLDEDLNLIFSRFGTILSCEVIRDKRTRDSLQYAFIEFEEQKDCEQAYFKMQGVLIDDHRIHVDFSQSVRPQRHHCPGRLLIHHRCPNYPRAGANPLSPSAEREVDSVV
jgi:RNA recognition motif-containing protein